MKKTNFWNDETVLKFCKLSTLGSYGDFEGCKTLESKLKRFKDLYKCVKS